MTLWGNRTLFITLILCTRVTVRVGVGAMCVCEERGGVRKKSANPRIGRCWRAESSQLIARLLGDHFLVEATNYKAYRHDGATGLEEWKAVGPHQDAQDVLVAEESTTP